MAGTGASRRHPVERVEPKSIGGTATVSSRRSISYERRAVLPSPHMIYDVRPAPAKQVQSRPAGEPVFARSEPKPASRRLQRSGVLMRQLVRTQQQKRRRRSMRRLDMRGLALTSLAVILFVFGVAVGVMQFNTNKEVKAQAETLAVKSAATTESSDGSLPDNGLPSEDAPSGGYWRPAPDEPKRIKIPSLGVNARILKMGVMPNGEIKTPANIYDAGWLETTAKPGEYGAMFIDGHVHGPSKPGVFYNIKKLQPGDKIQIERGDGQVFTYSVVKTETYSKDNVDMVAALNTAVPGKPGLNLMTCDGRYHPEYGYDHRVVVFAVLD